MKCLYTSDIHGNVGIYDRLFERAGAEDVGAVLVGGDLGPIAPPLDNMIRVQRSVLTDVFRPRAERVRALGKRVVLIPGNDDLRANDDVFAAGDTDGVWDLADGRAVDLDGTTILGCGNISLTPHILKDREYGDLEPGRTHQADVCPLDDPNVMCSVERDDADKARTLKEMLKTLIAQAREGSRTIVMAHVPPHATKLDVLWDGRRIGSQAVRWAIETLQPALGLHGHVHESPAMEEGDWRDRIGRTPIVNPGSSYLFGDKAMLHLISFDTDDIEGTLAFERIPVTE